MPDGIGRMKSLRMLPNLVLGKGKSKQMKELKDLSSMHGELKISGLENITDPEDVVIAQFGKKEYLEELFLDWGWIEERETTTLDERVLDAVQAHENLKKLTISCYGGKRLSTWIVGMSPSSYVMLQSLCISNCFNLETLPALGNLPALKSLTINGSNCIKSMGGEFSGGSSNPFPVLEILKIECMEVLERWSFSGRDGMGFPSLKVLRITWCPMLTDMPFCFPSLTVFEIEGCGNVFGSNMCSGGPSLGSLRLLKKLRIVELKCLEFLDDGSDDGCDVVFPALEKFEIRDMYALKIWSLPGRNRQGFPSLKKLKIHNCLELMTFPICFPSLTSLQIKDCNKLLGLEMCGAPSLGNLPALEDLTIKGLDCLESFNDGFYGDESSNASFFPALAKLEISEMPLLKTWCFSGGDRRGGFASLKELRIKECSQLSKIPFCFPCLTTLGISECDDLIEIEMFGGEEGSYGHSLLSIEITKCPKLEEIPNSFINLVDVYCDGGCNKLASLPRLQHAHNLWLSYVSESMSLKAAIQDSTYLEELSIESECSNLTVELLSMDLNRLTSLKHLRLMIPGDDYERMGWENDDQVAKRPPPNLSHLQISFCNFQMGAKVLTYFSNLNAPITSLEFSSCYDVESFPDVELPSTLQSLKISWCDALTTISGQFLSGCSNSLQELTIEYCDDLVCLPRSLSTLQSLRILSLEKCPKLEVLKECGFPTALTHLTIRNCDEMKAVSNLRLTKLTSLTHLELEKFPETSRLEAGCLPVSIEELTIRNFPRLETLSGVLPTLKNLRLLEVDDCPLVNQKPRSKMHKLIPQQFKSWTTNMYTDTTDTESETG